MNTADSGKIGEVLLAHGFQPTPAIEKADIIVVNGCVVRQKAENKAMALIDSLKSFKKKRPDLAITVTGCLVDSNIDELQDRLPHVSLFFRPQEFQVLERWLERQHPQTNGRVTFETTTGQAYAPPPHDVSSSSPRDGKVNRSPVAFLPVIKGCDSFCAYCIVPYRRGREVSHPPEEIVEEANCLVSQGVREITLLGQTVDSYGHDLPGKPDLADLLVLLEEIPGLYRVRFLTSHPKFLQEKLIRTMSHLRKVCPFFNLPVQSGDNEILKLMRRGYAAEDYKRLIQSVRAILNDSAISTDIIVGFPGEREEHFQSTLSLLEEIRFDSIHVAAYSPRRGTQAARDMTDDVPAAEKKRRLQMVEQLHERIAGEINSALLNRPVEVLVESEKKGKWQGRTRSNKLVFFTGSENLTGKLVQVKIVRTGPWSLSGELDSLKS